MSFLSRIAALAFACLAATPTFASQPEQSTLGGIPRTYADRIILNADVYTSNPTAPHAQAVAAKNGSIIWVGTNASVLNFRGPSTKVENLHGKQVLPGFVDAHEHMLFPFEAATELCFVPTFDEDGQVVIGADGIPVLNMDPTFDEVRTFASICAQQRPAGAWSVFLFGRKFYLSSHGRNIRVELSLASPNNPVTGFDAFEGHGQFANNAALNAAGISIWDADPYSGLYGRAADGSLDGFVHEVGAQALVFAAMATRHPDSYFAAQYTHWLDVAASVGIVSALDIPFEYSPTRAAAVKALVSHPVNLTVACLPLSPTDVCPEGLRAASGKLWIKSFADGGLKACIGWSKRGYLNSDEQCPSIYTPGYLGHSNLSHAEMAAAYRRVKSTPNACSIIHAYGSAAAQFALDVAKEEHMQGQCGTMEHWDMADPETVDGLAQLGWPLVQNPGHIQLKPVIDEYLTATEAGRASPYASVMARGVRLAFGRDGFGPIAPGVDSPFAWIAQVMEHWDPSERLTAEQGVIAATRESAQARREVGGMLVPGYPASWVEVDRKVIGADAATVRAATVLRTVIRGQDVYTAP
ncbi:amidohydrolase family protein [Corallococcus silvisoli]|uniref:amidohydrolase family protein n=1 Tax=Corallococcus silvisoli TaxID=2697031 RepID=UPI001377FC29|nr:amidohydrolase family protein [Corallococcus silvisoli]NBD11854.1 amidohydrolase family protein [Corallococcus silvisoli]